RIPRHAVQSTPRRQLWTRVQLREAGSPRAAGLRNPHNFLLNLTVPQRLVQRDEAQTQVARTLIHREETFGKCRSRADRPSIACSSTGKDSGKSRETRDALACRFASAHPIRAVVRGIIPRSTVVVRCQEEPSVHATSTERAGETPGASDGERQQTIGPGLAGPAETHRANQKEGSEPPRSDAPSLHPEGLSSEFSRGLRLRRQDLGVMARRQAS